jgi:undecaprenyl-diphosphatase
MNILQSLVLGIVQGATEFIPVSSSGHLILARHLMGLPEADLGFDIGTIAALLAYFWSDLWQIMKGVFDRDKSSTKLAINIIIATIPAVLLGVALSSKIETTFRSSSLVSFNLIWVGVAMLFIDRLKSSKTVDELVVKDAGKIGVFQALALVPGVSRSGISMIGGRFSGLKAKDAARFSFLISLPVTIGATMKSLLLDGGLTELKASPTISLVAILASGIVGLIAVRFLINYLAKYGFRNFAIYRIVAGAVMLLILNL